MLALATAGALGQSSLLAWGDNAYGKANVPPLPPGLTYIQVAGGTHHTLARRSDGAVVAWGNDTYNQCQVPSLPPGLSFVEVACGSYHSLARLSDGSVRAWGENANGQCNVPPWGPGLTAVQIAGGYRHSVALMSDGTISAWGGNPYGQTTVPPLPPGTTYVEVAASNDQTLARRSDGSMVAVGANGSGECNVPALPPGLTYVEVASAYNHSAARRSDGSVVVWGSNNFGEHNVPGLPLGLTYVEIAAGWNHTLARRSDGVVLAWGRNDLGQCAVPPLSAGATYVGIASGGNHSLAMRLQGPIYPWIPDTGFGSAGLVTVGDAVWNEQPRRLLVDSQGRIVVVGTRSGQGCVVWRFLPTGQLDPSFGTGGVATAGPTDAVVQDAVLEPGDSTVVSFHSSAGQLLRLSPSGQLDSMFGTGGVAVSPPPGPALGPMLRRSTGELFVCGWYWPGPFFSNVVAVQFLANGTPDPAFGVGGFVNYGVTSGADACAFDLAGNIVLAGIQNYWTSSSMYVAKLDATNNISWQLGLVFGGTFDRAFAVTVDPQGRIYVGGNAQNIGANAVARLFPNGTPDPAFGTQGLVATPGPATTRILLTPAGELLVPGSGGFGLRRYLDSGQVDTAWGNQGTLSTAHPVDTRDFAFLPDGSLVVTGPLNNGADYDVAVLRYYQGPGSIAASTTLSLCASPATLHLSGNPSIGNHVLLEVNGATGLAFAGYGFPALIPIPVPCGCEVISDGSGALGYFEFTSSWSLAIPNDSFLIGVSFFAQGIDAFPTSGGCVFLGIPFGLTDIWTVTIG